MERQAGALQLLCVIIEASRRWVTHRRWGAWLAGASGVSAKTGLAALTSNASPATSRPRAGPGPPSPGGCAPIAGFYKYAGSSAPWIVDAVDSCVRPARPAAEPSGDRPRYDVPGIAKNSCTSIVASGEW